MNILQTLNLNCEVIGKGETDAAVLEDAFKQLRLQCNERVMGNIISLNANTVNLINKEQVVKKERFLYLFFPRERISYVLTLNIEVEVKYINLKED
jgi:uncharacterized protein (TIGR03578 family)